MAGLVLYKNISYRVRFPIDSQEGMVYLPREAPVRPASACLISRAALASSSSDLKLDPREPSEISGKVLPLARIVDPFEEAAGELKNAANEEAIFVEAGLF